MTVLSFDLKSNIAYADEMFDFVGHGKKERGRRDCGNRSDVFIRFVHFLAKLEKMLLKRQNTLELINTCCCLPGYMIILTTLLTIRTFAAVFFKRSFVVLFLILVVVGLSPHEGKHLFFYYLKNDAHFFLSSCSAFFIFLHKQIKVVRKRGCLSNHYAPPLNWGLVVMDFVQDIGLKRKLS